MNKIFHKIKKLLYKKFIVIQIITGRQANKMENVQSGAKILL
jgi:hypothetical protein